MYIVLTCGMRWSMASPDNAPTAKATRNCSKWLQNTRCMMGMTATPSKPTRLMIRMAKELYPHTEIQKLYFSLHFKCFHYFVYQLGTYRSSLIFSAMTVGWVVKWCPISGRTRKTVSLHFEEEYNHEGHQEHFSILYPITFYQQPPPLYG